jgi:hypothetical protein
MECESLLSLFTAKLASLRSSPHIHKPTLCLRGCRSKLRGEKRKQAFALHIGSHPSFHRLTQAMVSGTSPPGPLSAAGAPKRGKS